MLAQHFLIVLIREGVGEIRTVSSGACAHFFERVCQNFHTRHTCQDSASLDSGPK